MSSKSTGQPQIIELVRIKSWYIPADAVAYQALKAASVPMLIIHKDFLPTLQMATRRKNLRARQVDWESVFGSAMDKIGTAWKAKDGRVCKISDSKLIFTSPATERNRKAVSKLEASLSRFFARWAFRYRPVFSETADRYRLVVDFKFDPALTPVVPAVPVDVVRNYELQLGFSKVSITFYDKPTEELTARGMIAPLVLLQVFTQTGSTWHPTHTSTFKSNQIGDVTKFLPGVAELVNRMQIEDARQ